MAISITIFFVSVFAIVSIVLVFSQATRFWENFPYMVVKFDLFMHQIEYWVASTFHISSNNIKHWIDDTNSEIISGSRIYLGKTLINIGSILIILFLIPVYVFMILIYQPLLINFIHQIFREGIHKDVNEVLSATKKIVQSYLIGLMLEALIIATLNSICLLVIGIDYAILLGVLGAFLNVIPYVGGITSISLPIIIAATTKSPMHAMMVLFFYLLIQFADNHYIIPKVVASKVKLNALASVIVVLVGGALWGIPGMFLSIPLTAIIKVVFDHVEVLKPWGYLLGTGEQINNSKIL